VSNLAASSPTSVRLTNPILNNRLSSGHLKKFGRSFQSLRGLSPKPISSGISKMIPKKVIRMHRDVNQPLVKEITRSCLPPRSLSSSPSLQFPLIPGVLSRGPTVHTSLLSLRINFKNKKIISQPPLPVEEDILNDGSKSKLVYKTKHPVTKKTMRGLRGTKKGVSESSAMTQDQYYDQLYNDSQAFTFNSIVPNSQVTYSSMQKPWHAYCGIIGTSPTLTIIPKIFMNLERRVGKLPYDFRIFALRGFLSYLVNDKGGKPIKPRSAGNYLSSVRKYLQDNNIDVLFMDNSPFLTSDRAGLLHEASGLPGNAIADTGTLPVTIDMIEIVKDILLDIMKHTKDLALWTFCCFSYTRLCRLCELIKVSGTEHHLLSDNVVFTLMPKGLGIYKGVQPIRYELVPSYDMDKCIKNRVTGHYIDLTDSKRDPLGRGDRCPHERQLILGPDSVFDLTDVAYTWAERARPAKGKSFFSSRSTGFILTRPMINKFFKLIAQHFNLNPKRIRPHSLRYAGACGLAALNVPPYIIMKMGRWDSLVFLRYVKVSIASYVSSAIALANRWNFSFRDVQMLCPSA
jgi:hypothetical protein